MSDIFMTIMVVAAVALVLFIFPLQFIANQNEVIENANVQTLRLSN